MFPFLIPVAFLGAAYYVSRPSYQPYFGGLPRSFPPHGNSPLSRAQLASGQPVYGAHPMYGALDSESLYEEEEYGMYDDFEDEYGATVSDRSEIFFDGDDQVSLFSTTLDDF